VRYTIGVTPPVNTGACLPSALATSPVFLLGRLGYALKRQAVAELEEAGYSFYEYSVLTLAEDGTCKAQTEIADVLLLDRSQLVGLLDGLEERGLIERQRDQNDRRRHVVKLTRGGRQELGRLRTLVNRIEDEFLAPLDAESRSDLFAILSRLARAHDTRFAVPADVAVAS